VRKESQQVFDKGFDKMKLFFRPCQFHDRFAISEYRDLREILHRTPDMDRMAFSHNCLAPGVSKSGNFDGDDPEDAGQMEQKHCPHRTYRIIRLGTVASETNGSRGVNSITCLALTLFGITTVSSSTRLYT